MDENAPETVRDELPFGQHHAFIIGIDAYQNVSTLQTAVADAQLLAQVLAEQQHFKVHAPLLDASGGQIRELFQAMSQEVGSDDRVFFYFAGHGIAADGDDGPAGYIVPADADPRDVKTLIPMGDLQKALESLPCRHLLLVLDCCFSGAFKWSSQYRAIGTLMPKKIYKERFDRFITDPAWQVITSAAYDQKALDVVDGKATGDRGSMASADNKPHSPFAHALVEGLAGFADFKGEREGDGVITVTELYAYIRDQVEPETIEADPLKRQTPRFFPFKKHDKGEYIFLHPKHRLNLPPIPTHTPFKGLESFNEEDHLLFYGRDDAIRDLRAKMKHNRLVVVSGASGTGKSSVIKAGLLPLLREEGFRILPVMRPGNHPLAEIDKILAQSHANSADEAGQPTDSPPAVLLIDQFEEVITRCIDPKEREQFDARLRQLLDEGHFHRIILTVRADFEPQLNNGALRGDWIKGRYTVPPFSLEELNEAIVLPTMQEVLIFDPPELVDEIAAEVVQSPGALPLLSYALSELYEAYRSSGRQDRALKKGDYDKLGGVMGALRTKAENLYESLQPAQRAAMRKIMLRMVSVEGDLAGQRVPIADFDYSPEENRHVQEVIERLVEARLVVKGLDYIEPAHDALVRAWKTLHDWIHAAGRDKLLLRERLSPEAQEFARTGNRALLWYDKPHLTVAEVELDNPQHGFNAREVDFIRKSVARNKRNTKVKWGVALASLCVLSVALLFAVFQWYEADNQRSVAEETNRRALVGLFSDLKMNMDYGQPGSLCVYGLCDGGDAPPGDGDDTAWLSLGELQDDSRFYGEQTSGVFSAVRQYGEGTVLVYAQDGLFLDSELLPGSDNLRFAENALRWLTPLYEEEGCGSEITILLWEGTYAKNSNLSRVRKFIELRGWKLQVTTPETLEIDLQCAEVLWYLSDWDPPADFAEHQVPLIEEFVYHGGGLLVGGLGWSYAQQSGPEGTPAIYPYPADELGAPFGFEFTPDAFMLRKGEFIILLPSQ